MLHFHVRQAGADGAGAGAGAVVAVTEAEADAEGELMVLTWLTWLAAGRQQRERVGAGEHVVSVSRAGSIAGEHAGGNTKTQDEAEEAEAAPAAVVRPANLMVPAQQIERARGREAGEESETEDIN